MLTGKGTGEAGQRLQRQGLLTDCPLWFQHSLYVGAASGVLQFPLSSCSRYQSCYDCILARDPYCGWDPSTHACMVATAVANRSQGRGWG